MGAAYSGRGTARNSASKASIAVICRLGNDGLVTKLKVGDVFLVPLDGERYGIGQLAGDWKSELYVVIYDKLVKGRFTSRRKRRRPSVRGAHP